MCWYTEYQSKACSLDYTIKLSFEWFFIETQTRRSETKEHFQLIKYSYFVLTINSSIECLEHHAGSRSQLEQSMLLSSKKCLRFGNINPRYSKNKTELFIDHVIDKKMDVCVVTETWLIYCVLLSLAKPTARNYLHVDWMNLYDNCDPVLRSVLCQFEQLAQNWR